MPTPGHSQVTENAPARRRSDRGDLFDPSCPTRQLLDRVGSKWTTMAILTLAAGSPGELRFSELKRRMRGISQKVLTQTLRSLERDGIVTRRVQPTSPPQVHYGLTETGISLVEPLGILRDWAETHMPTVSASGRTWDAQLA